MSIGLNIATDTQGCCRILPSSYAHCIRSISFKKRSTFSWRVPCISNYFFLPKEIKRMDILNTFVSGFILELFISYIHFQ